jgi:hypothetical protein
MLVVAVMTGYPLFSSSGSPEPPTVPVLYAGSLGAVTENGVGPGFIKATGIAYLGEARGS